MKKFLSVVSCALLFLAAGSPAGAVPIAPTDLDFLTLGVMVNSASDDFISAPGGNDIGDLDNELWFDSTTGLFTYVHTVTPSVNNISEFNTGFNVLGFNGVAGWSFGDAGAAGGLGTAADFDIDLGADGTLDWNSSTDFFDSGESIAFFFQSPYNATLGNYNLINSEVATAQSFAPVPEPATVMLLGTSLLLLGGGLRRKVQR